MANKNFLTNASNALMWFIHYSEDGTRLVAHYVPETSSLSGAGMLKVWSVRRGLLGHVRCAKAMNDNCFQPSFSPRNSCLMYQAPNKNVIEICKIPKKGTSSSGKQPYRGSICIKKTAVFQFSQLLSYTKKP